MAKHLQGKRYKQDSIGKKTSRARNEYYSSNSSVNNIGRPNKKDIDPNKKRTKSKKKKINVFLILFIVLFIYSAFILLRWIWSNYSAKQATEQIKEEVVEVINTSEESDEYNQEKSVFNKIDFTKLKEINSDVVGYIEVPNTNISYPVLQAKDNEYYLNRDIYKKYSGCGSVFMDYTNNPNFSDSNTVLFGHNLITGMMFANLNKIVTGELGNEIYINIYTEKANYRYQMFATYKSAPTKEPINTKISNEKEFIDTALQKSNVKCNIYPNERDNILTLSTCDSSGKSRVIVHGVRILEETPQK